METRARYAPCAFISLRGRGETDGGGDGGRGRGRRLRRWWEGELTPSVLTQFIMGEREHRSRRETDVTLEWQMETVASHARFSHLPHCSTY